MTASATVEQPVWFGPEPRPVFGWLATPSDGTALGGVLLAPPVGREARAARRALRRTALALARKGFVALRFDYAGTGDAAGHLDDPDLDRAWCDSVGAAAELLRSCEVPSVSAIGMRIGATVVGATADVHDLSLASLVLWDPCESGRGYLRELRALEAFRHDQVDAAADGSVVTAEYVFTERAAAELRRLRLASVERRPLADRVLVAVRSDRPVSEALRARLDEERVEWTTLDDQAAMMDVDPLHAPMPDRAMRHVVEWLSAASEVREVLKEPTDVRTAIVLKTEAAPVQERVVRLGPAGLFGILDEPLTAPRGPLIVFLNVSNEEHVGPSRLWVELSRAWAARGLRCVRFDLTGLGDSPWRPGEPEPPMYDQRWLGDVADVVSTLCPDDPSDVVLVGLCSGAFLAVEAGRSLGARGVCVINPPVGMDVLHAAARLASSRRASVRALAGSIKELALRMRWLAVVVGKVGRVVMPSVFGADAMAELAASGTDLLVLASAEDLSPAPETRRLDRFFSRRLVAPRNYPVTFVPGLDHSLHDAIGRRRTVAALEAHVLGRFAVGATAPERADQGRPT